MGASAERSRRRPAQRRPAPAAPLVPIVLWSPLYGAWTLPGRYLYITSELQQTLQSDDAVAFVLAHEMAHHDLGHVAAATAEPGDEARSILTRLRKRLVGYPSIWERKQRLLLGIAPEQADADAEPEPGPGRRRIPDPPEYL